MIRHNLHACLAFLAAWLLASCMKDKPTAYTTAIPAGKQGVYVVCEGQYPRPDAALYLYKPAADSVFGDLYSAVNGQPLGEVFQSMTRIGNNFFLSVNNSDKVVVIDAASLTLVATIGISQPRYILPVGNNKAYVSTLYSNKLFVINTATFAVVDSIVMPALNPEGMCLVDNNAFVCTWDTGTQNICKIDVTTNHITQVIATAGYAPHDVVADKDDLLWVMGGNQAYGKQATLTHIDPATGDLLASFTFPSSANPIKPVFNARRDTLYYIEANFNGALSDNGIFRMGIHDAALPTQAFIAANANQYFWGLGIDPASGNVYVGDPKDFNQQGAVYIYRQDATLQKVFTVGVGPGMFFFDE